MPLFREFLNENANRYYPFYCPSGVANTVPTALLVDFHAFVSSADLNNTNTTWDTNSEGYRVANPDIPTTTGYGLYINKIITDSVTVGVGLGAVVGTTTYDFGTVAIATIDDVLDKIVDFKVVQNGYVIEGYVVFGDTREALNMQGVTDLDSDYGMLYPGCIQVLTEWLMGIKVGDTTLSGVITLEAGAGVSLNVSGNTISITCCGAEVPVQNTQITTDADILSAITAQYGAPITSINGNTIGSNDTPNNWSIASYSGAITSGGTTSESPYGNSLQIEAIASSGIISIRDVNAAACCTQDDIATLLDNLSSLNTRVGLVENAQDQLESDINVVNTQQTRLL